MELHVATSLRLPSITAGAEADVQKQSLCTHTRVHIRTHTHTLDAIDRNLFFPSHQASLSSTYVRYDDQHNEPVGPRCLTQGQSRTQLLDNIYILHCGRRGLDSFELLEFALESSRTRSAVSPRPTSQRSGPH